MKKVRILYLIFGLAASCSQNKRNEAKSIQTEEVPILTIQNRGGGRQNDFDWILYVNGDPIVPGNSRPLYWIDKFILKEGENTIQLHTLHDKVDVDEIGYGTTRGVEFFKNNNESKIVHIQPLNEIGGIASCSNLDKESDTAIIKKFALELVVRIEERDADGLFGMFNPNGLAKDQLFKPELLAKSVIFRPSSEEEISCLVGNKVMMVVSTKDASDPAGYRNILSWKDGLNIPCFLFVKKQGSLAMMAGGKLFEIKVPR